MSEKSFGDKKDYVSSDSSEENRIRPRILNKGNKDNIVLNDESLEVNLSQPSPSLMSRIEKRPRNTSDDTDENNTEGFTLVERKRRSKRLNRSLSQNNLSDLTRMNNLSDFPRKNRVEPLQSIVQTCEDGEVCVTSKEDLPKQVGLAKLLRSDGIQNIQKITYKNSCKVLVRFNSKQDAEKLLQSKKISDLGYRCQLTTELNLTYGILRRIELDVTEEEIKNDFDCMYKIVSAKRLKRLDERGAWVDSETVRVCFQSSTLPPYVSAYGYGIKVELNYFPVTQCSGCWKFGHLLRVCPSKKKMCPKCGGAHDNCEATTFVCINCKGKHMALDKSCPSYQKERWIRAIMAEENCTYRIALQKVLSHKKDQETVHAVLKETDAVDEHIALPGTSSTLPTNYRDSVLKKATKQSPNTEIEMEQDGSESSEEESNLERNQKHVGTTKPKKVKGKKKNNTQKKARRDQDTDAESKDDCARLQTTPDQENIHRKKNLFSWALFLKKAKNIIVSDVSLEEKIKLGFKLIMEAITKFVFQIAYSPTGFEKYGYTCTVADFRVSFSVWDTSGTTSYDTVRPLAYQDAKIFMLCFNVAEPESLHNAAAKWYREVRTHGGSAPVLLCGCKADLRHDKETLTMLSKLKAHPVTSEEALGVARQLGATTYVETSARASSKGVKDAFEVAAFAALGKLNKQQIKQQKQQVGRSKSKRDLKAELKGRAKSCCVM